MADKLQDIPPLDFNDEQKVEYDMLLRQARLLFPEVEDFVLKIGVGAYVRKVDKTKFGDEEEIKKLKEDYQKYTFDPDELAKKPLEKSNPYIDNNNEVLQTDPETYPIST